MSRYRKKPVEIAAEPVRSIINAAKSYWYDLPLWVQEAYDEGIIVALTQDSLTIKTLEGDHLARLDDMVIRGVKGELYPCKPDIFDATYDKVSDSSAN